MTSEKFNLAGKHAIITGGAGLLGIEHASALLESNATVIITDISESLLSKAREKLEVNFNPEKIITFKMDVTDLGEIRAVVNQIEDLNIRVDILVNNAAIDPKVIDDGNIVESSRLENFSLDNWNTQINVGLTGAFLASQNFGSLMARDKKGGVILNIASDLSVISPDQRIYRKEGIEDKIQPVKPITYSVIKSGLVGMTLYLATYWSDLNIRSNALSPGGIYNEHDDEFVTKLSSLIPLGRMANRDEYRSAIQFLCSDASSYMNGQNIIMDGGRSIW
ncbi:MAG: SDR family oxidoreductase [Gammaproteobacteria bacterium]|jgi:NAD(P)-dependent dehydrogenase (short-subunit alcohol dehydrogenase family)|nr:SDR family oxidoreductase [Gammaproteobacteria bacterium]